jgi:molecular chaperone GrpE
MSDHPPSTHPTTAMPADDDAPSSSSRISTPPSASGNGSASAGSDTSSGPESEVAAVASAKADVERFREQWMRTAADFDNYRKRSRKETDDARKAGREELLKELLPVFDNLERGLASAKGATDVKGVIDGLSMILKQFEGTLGKVGISRVPTVGSSFDPSLHEAIQQIETSDHPPGTVVAEVQPGYLSGDRLVRAAMVVVAKPPAASSDADSTN